MSEIDNLRKIINDRADAWINETEDDTDDMSAEVALLNAYAMRLLSDETRLWQCKKCGEEFSGMYHGQHVIPAAEGQCPLCGDGIAVPKAWVMQEEIDRLRKALEKIADHCRPQRGGEEMALDWIEHEASEALEVKG